MTAQNRTRNWRPRDCASTPDEINDAVYCIIVFHSIYFGYGGGE